jgi:hypothetical protein
MHGPNILVAIVGHESDDAIIELFNQCSKFRIFHDLDISCCHDYFYLIMIM